MGEQTLVQTQTHSQNHPPSSSSSPPELSQPNSDSVSRSPPLSNPVADALDDSNLPQKSSNPSKIPIRPQEIRKLSSNSDSAVNANTNTTSSAETSEKKLLQVADSVSASSSSSSPVQTSASASTPTFTATTSGTTVIPTITPISTTGGNGTITTASSTPKNQRWSAFQSSRVRPQIIKPLTVVSEGASEEREREEMS